MFPPSLSHHLLGIELKVRGESLANKALLLRGSDSFSFVCERALSLRR